jgi:hypothetical protein
VEHTSRADLTQYIGKNSNLDILPSPGSLIFSHYIRHSIKLVQIGMDFFFSGSVDQSSVGIIEKGAHIYVKPWWHDGDWLYSSL